MTQIKILLIIVLIFCADCLIAQSVRRLSPLPGDVKEMHVQEALKGRKAENYAGAIAHLDTILVHNPKDAGILLFKGDLQLQSKLYKDAVETYKKILPLKFETTITQINLSYALFMNHQPANALKYAGDAWKQNKTNTNAVVNYFNAMLWNLKTKEAAKFLSEQTLLLKPDQVLVLKARLYTTGGDYTKGLMYYDSLYRTYPDKNYTQEYAEVLLGKKEMKQSQETMKASEKLFTVNEYKAFTEKLKASKMQNAGTEFVYFKDVAKNIRIENIVWWQQRDGRKYRFRLSAGASSITSILKEKTTARFAHVTITERWNKAWSGQTDVHLQNINPSTGESFVGLTGKQTIQYQPNDRRMIGLVYSTDILNFTASLLGKNIRSNSLGYVTHLLITGKTGFYSQGSAGMLNDNNQQYQFFGSLYHLFRTDPTFKAGLNFSALHYSDSSIKTYFSPNKYVSSEVFADYNTALPNLSKFYLQLQAATGIQKIEQQSWETAFRFQAEIGMRLKHLETALKYQTSNVASAVGTGYKFNWFTLRVMWKW